MMRLSRRTAVSVVSRAAMVPAAALAVHQLRFVLAYGNGAGAELAGTGHSYLHSLVPWIVLLVGCSTGGVLWALGRALAGQRTPSRRTISFLALWLVCTLCLVAIYSTQELLEGWFATGHPTGWIGIFGYGGWWAIPAATAVGLVLASLFHGVARALDEISERCGHRPNGRTRIERARRPVDALVLQRSVLADGWSGRGPPR